MKRRLFTILSALSLLLCVGVVVLWVRSYWREDRISVAYGAGPYRAMSVRLGELHFQRAGNWPVPIWSDEDRFRAESSDVADDGQWDDLYPRPERLRAYSGFRYLNGYHWYHGTDEKGNPAVDTVEVDVITMPLWFIAGGATIMPMLWLWIRFVAWHRNRCCLCLHCGYDLRASPDRCPECGNAIPEKAAP